MAWLPGYLKRLWCWILFYGFLDTYLWHPLPGLEHRKWFPWHPGDTTCMSKEGLAAESNQTSLKLVFASVGQTGTTSVAQAARLLGLRTYHIEERYFFLRPTLREDVTPEVFARTVSRCRVEALSLEPYTDMLPVVLATSPDVKVVLSWRDHASWSRSTASSGIIKDLMWSILMVRIAASSMRMLPWIDVWNLFTGEFDSFIDGGEPFSGSSDLALSTLVATFTFGRPGYVNKANNFWHRGTLKIFGQEEAYLASQDEIRRLVPPDRLVEINVRTQGWPELERATGLKRPKGMEKFPHPRSKNSWTNDVVWDKAALRTRLSCAGLFVVMHIVNFEVVRLLWRLLMWAKKRAIGGPKTD